MYKIFFGWHFWLTLAIAACAIGLRLWLLPSQLLADDEWHAVNKLLSSNTYWDIFKTFGFADHCIPLTLWYNFLAEHGALTEWQMRLPLLIAGLATPVSLPYLLRKNLRTAEVYLFAFLLSVSPLLVYFSRTARPYSISTLAALLAVIAFYHWWRTDQRRYAFIYAFSAAIAIWFQLITIFFVAAPFLILGSVSVYHSTKTHQWHKPIKILILGCSTLTIMLLLVGVPLWSDFNALSSKSGVDIINLETLIVAAGLWSGGSSKLWMLMILLTAGYGGWIFYHRQRQWFLYLSTISALTFILVAISGGAWLHHALVLVRYLLPILPLGLLFLAIGIVGLALKLPLISLRYCGAALLLALLVYYSPLRQEYRQPVNQFTGHMGYQFDYNLIRNIYRKKYANEPVSPWFYELGKADPGSKTLISAPWALEWHFNRWYLDQQVHQQYVKAGFVIDFCVDETFGEYSSSNKQPHFQHMVYLKDHLLTSASADYLVLYRPTEELKQYHRFPFWPECEAKIIALMGTPDYQDQWIIVYQLSGATDESL